MRVVGCMQESAPPHKLQAARPVALPQQLRLAAGLKCPAAVRIPSKLSPPPSTHASISGCVCFAALQLSAGPLLPELHAARVAVAHGVHRAPHGQHQSCLLIPRLPPEGVPGQDLSALVLHCMLRGGLSLLASRRGQWSTLRFFWSTKTLVQHARFRSASEAEVKGDAITAIGTPVLIPHLYHLHTAHMFST